MKYPAHPLSICFYSPYVPKHFGGGERHFFTIASVLSRFFDVIIAISNKTPLTEEEVKLIRKAYSEKFGLDLSWVEFRSTPIGTDEGFVKKLLWTRQFDKFFAVSDGSIFFSLAKQNILHIQIPFTHPQSGIFSRLKLKNWEINTNSVFTKEVIERKWQVHVESVLYPCVDIHQITPGKKDKIILNIGRFFRQLHTKRQDVMVDAFIKLLKQYPKQMNGWRLVLIGQDEDKSYAQSIAKKAQAYPITILHDAKYSEVLSYLRKAKVYWHATGYQIDDFVHPEQAEHFGITTIEAMAAGCIPIVANKGGQKEIVEHGVNGFLWNEVEGLIEKTLAVVDGSFDTNEMSIHARERAEFFDQSNFIPDVFALFHVPFPSAVPIQELGISAVIPTFNGVKVLEKHLPAVEACLQNQDEIVIIDDASSDETVPWLKKRYRLKEVTDRASFDEDLYEGNWHHNNKNLSIRLVVNKKNARFAASVNKAVKFAQKDLIFLLNNDVSPKKDVLSHLLPYFTAHPDRVKKKNASLPPPDKIFGVSPAEIDKGKIIAGRNELWFERGMFVHSKAKRMSTGETAWLSGGSALINKQKWEELKGFDTDYYPAYWEDIDLSMRARKKGWAIRFESRAEVFHHHETTNQDAFGTQRIQIMSLKNSFVFLRKHTSLFQKLQFMFWLPYHLTVTNYRSNGAYFLGLIKAIEARWSGERTF